LLITFLALKGALPQERYVEEKVAGVHCPSGLVRIPADALENAIIISGQHEED
jgi:hypothetical protein